LFEFDIAGLRKSASAGFLARLMPGAEVSLKRSLTTAAEINVFCGVQRIGAIPRASSGAVAQLLDRGLPLVAVIRPVNEGVHHRGPVCVDIGLSVDQPARRTQPSWREYFEAADALLEEAATAMAHRNRVGDVSTYLRQALYTGARGWLTHDGREFSPSGDDHALISAVKARSPAPIAHRWHAAMLELWERDWEEDSNRIALSDEQSFERRQRERDSLRRLNLRRLDHVWTALALAGHTCGYAFADRHGTTNRMTQRKHVPVLGEPDASQRRRLIATLGYLCRTMMRLDREKLSYVLYEVEQDVFRQRGHAMTGLSFFAWHRGPIATALWEEWDAPAPDLAECIAQIGQPRRCNFNDETWEDASALSAWERALLCSTVNQFGQVDAAHLSNRIRSSPGAWIRTWRAGLGAYERVEFGAK
jgi:hypothetical protein